jgi:Xaa-Pro dipeptidase
MAFSRRSFIAAGASAELLKAQSASPIASLTNRTAEAKPITDAERAQRIDRARALMQKTGIAAIAVAGGTTLNYFTGVRWGNSERPTMLVIPAKGPAFAVSPAFEEERLRERLTTGTQVYTWQENESAYQQVATGLRELGIATGKIGMDETVPYVFAEGIGKALPQATVVNALPVTGGCRAIKSPAELALMQLANSVTLQVYEAAWKAGRPGMTTREFSALIGAGYAKTGFNGFGSCETAEYSALPHGSIKPQTIKENQIVLIDDGCTVEGYQSDISRTFVYGKPTDEMKRCFDTVYKAQQAALAAARPGAECQSVDAAARKVIVDAGYEPGYANFTHRLGHGIGMDGHEWPYLVQGNTLPLAANMTFSDEPGIYLRSKFGVRIEDDMYITNDGAKLFTTAKPSLEQPF